jgi:hypothetical protein
MAEEDDEIERLTREALDAIQRLSVVVPMVIRKARKAGAREVAERIARIATQFPDDQDEDVTSSQAKGEPKAPRPAPNRGSVALLASMVDGYGPAGTFRRGLRDHAYSSGMKRSTFHYALQALLASNEVVEFNGRLYGIRHAPVGASPVKDTGTAAEAELPAEQEAAAPVHSQHEEGPLWNRPSA